MLDYSKRKCYGFVKNNSIEFIINKNEAQSVKLIFACFLGGMSLNEIAKTLLSKGVSSPSGKDTWSRKVLSSTLSNEKYVIYGIICKIDFEMVQEHKEKRNPKKDVLEESIEADITKTSIEEKISTSESEEIVSDVKAIYYHAIQDVRNYICDIHGNIMSWVLKAMLLSKFIEDG